MSVAVPSRRGRADGAARSRAGSGIAVDAPARASRGPLALVVLVAAALRLIGVGHVALDPFYDAAVRSMGTSWHAFFTGAIDPSARVAVDKPPVDLWLQVASTKLLGFTPFALHLPEALAGTLTVLVLFDALHGLFGRAPALAGAAALAVLPMSVITARSDTMDSVMALLVVGALALTVRATVPGARAARLLVGAGALLGLAFQVKLFEALVAAPALLALWWFAGGGSRRARAAPVALAGATFAVVAVSWLAALSLAGGPRPWAFGSTNGSAWNATFVYDGLDRLRGMPPGSAPAAAMGRTGGGAPAAPVAGAAPPSVRAARTAAARLAQKPAPPGPIRLLRPRAGVGAHFGVALAGAVLALLLAVAAGVPRSLSPRARTGWWALVGWLGTGTALFSAQSALKPRYLEAVDPALAAVLGVGVVLAARGLLTRRDASPRASAPRRLAARSASLLAAGLLALALALPAAISVHAARAGVEDAGAPGALPAASVGPLTAFLRGHQDGARYEAATIAVGKAASLIAHDGRPVLPLTTLGGRPLVPVPVLASAVARGAVRYALVGSVCSPRSPDRDTACSPSAVWIRAHGVDVSRGAGQPHAGLLYALGAARPPAPAPRRRSTPRRPDVVPQPPRLGAPRDFLPLSAAGTPRGTRKSRAWRRTRGARSARPPRASRGPARRSGRAARRSRRRSGSSAAR